MKYKGPLYKLHKIYLLADNPRLTISGLRYHQKQGWKTAGINPERISVPNQFGSKYHFYTEKGKNTILEFLEKK